MPLGKYSGVGKFLKKAVRKSMPSAVGRAAQLAKKVRKSFGY